LFDLFSYGYLGFALGPEDTIYYLTGAPMFDETGQRVKPDKSSTAKGESKGRENINLITFNISKEEYKDHGSLHFEDATVPAYVNSIAVGKVNGKVQVFSLGRVTRKDFTRTELFFTEL